MAHNERKCERLQFDELGGAPFWRNLAAKIVPSEIAELEEKENKKLKEDETKRKIKIDCRAKRKEDVQFFQVGQPEELRWKRA